LKKLKIGYSTCPNDTYIFAGLSNPQEETSPAFETVLADVETLNEWALKGRLDVTKLSFFAFGRVRETYGLLPSGGALGRGCGPILATRAERDLKNLKDRHGQIYRGRARQSDHGAPAVDPLFGP
jgi:1,4-dihydroxy-6-naphthoate synthase